MSYDKFREDYNKCLIDLNIVNTRLGSKNIQSAISTLQNDLNAFLQDIADIDSTYALKLQESNLKKNFDSTLNTMTTFNDKTSKDVYYMHTNKFLEFLYAVYRDFNPILIKKLATPDMPHSKNDQIDPSNGYIIAVPLKRTTFTSNNYTVSKIAYDDTNPAYKPNGKYTISCSSYADASHNAFNAFNASTKTSWKCNYANNKLVNAAIGQSKYTQDPYSGAIISNYMGGGTSKISTNVVGETLPITGEWIQIAFPYAFYLQKYSILTPPINKQKNTYPRILYVLGSNSDVNSSSEMNWDIVQICYLTSSPAVPYTGVAVDPNDYMNTNYKPIQSYSVYRLVIHQAADNVSTVEINQWNLWGSIVNNPETFTNLSSSTISMSREITYFNIDERKNNYSLAGTVQVSPIVEGFGNSDLTLGNNIVTNYNAVQGSYDDIVSVTGNLRGNPAYNYKSDQVYANDGTYSMSGNSVVFSPHVKTVAEVMSADTHLREAQQQMLFGLGIICMTSLLILAFSVAKE